MAHAKLSPSGAGTWAICPGSVKAQEGIPDRSGGAAREGTAAHALAEMCLRTKTEADEHIGEVIMVEGYRYEVDDSMARHIQTYLNYIASIASMADEVFFENIEEQVVYDHIVPEGHGSADFVIAYREGDINILHVVDLKYGMTEVIAENNLQALLYGIGARNNNEWCMDGGFDEIRMTIHQPRLNDDPSEWFQTAEELDQWEVFFAERAKAALSENPEFVPGEAQCRWCRAKPLCRARRDYALQIALFDFDEETDTWNENEGSKPKPSLLSLDEVSELLQHVDAVAKWCREVKDFAYAEAMAGKPIQGYKLVAGSRNRAWRDEEHVGEFLEKLEGVNTNDVFITKVISPAQAEKLLGKKKAGELLADEIEVTIGKPKLVPEAHKAPAIEVDPSSDFGDYDDDSPE